MFQEGTDTALDDQVQRPAALKPPEQGFWKTAGQVAAAPFQGVAAGSTKTAAFGAEIAGAFGSVLGATDGFSGGMFSTGTPEERQQQETARRKLLQDGPQFSNAPADTLRERAREVMPDPNSTHAAAQLVAGVAEFGTQAIGYTALGGMVAGPALLGADAGFAEADKLRLQGVDLGTRAAAGAVAGVVAGASVALPVAGKTLAGTAALVAAGGPGGFIAQNAAERAILQNGGYSKIANTYDPFDPVALTFATLVPAAFGGAALRGARMRAASEAEILRPAVELTPAEQAHSDAFERSDANLRELQAAIASEKRPEVKAMLQKELATQTENQRRYGQAVAAEPEAVPAARVRQTAATVDSYRLTPDSDIRGMTAHQDAMETAHGQLARGEPVAVTDLLNLSAVRNGAMLDELIASGEQARATLLGDAGNLAQAGDIRAIRAELDQVRAARPDDSAAAVKARAGELQDSDRLSYKQASKAAQKEIDLQVQQHEAQIQRLTTAIESNARAQRATQDIGQIDASLADLRERRAAVDAPAASPRALALAINDLFRQAPPRPRLVVEAPARRTQPPAEAPAGGNTAPRTGDAPAEPQQMPGDAPAAAGSDSVNGGAGRPQPAAAQASALDARATQAAEMAPDLMVQLEGREPMRASDLLETVRREAAEEAQDASLIDVAANCFLRS